MYYYHKPPKQRLQEIAATGGSPEEQFEAAIKALEKQQLSAEEVEKLWIVEQPLKSDYRSPEQKAALVEIEQWTLSSDELRQAQDEIGFSRNFIRHGLRRLGKLGLVSAVAAVATHGGSALELVALSVVTVPGVLATAKRLMFADTIEYGVEDNMLFRLTDYSPATESLETVERAIQNREVMISEIIERRDGYNKTLRLVDRQRDAIKRHLG